MATTPSAPSCIDIETQWEKESKIDKAKLVEESLENDYLHSKYLKLFRQCRQELSENIKKYDRVVHVATEYYSGKAPAEVYKKRPFDKKVLKQDMNKYLAADPEVARFKAALNESQLKVEMVESIIKQISYRSFNIKNAIEYTRFLAGDR